MYTVWDDVHEGLARASRVFIVGGVDRVSVCLAEHQRLAMVAAVAAVVVVMVVWGGGGGGGVTFAVAVVRLIILFSCRLHSLALVHGCGTACTTPPLTSNHATPAHMHLNIITVLVAVLLCPILAACQRGGTCPLPPQAAKAKGKAAGGEGPAKKAAAAKTATKG